MTAPTPALSVDAIDAALAAATPGLDEDGRRLAAVVLRLLAAGEPVSVLAAAAAAGMPASRAGQLLRSWPGVFWDDRDLVAGFWGLALAPMPHRIRRAGADLHAWCAWDPLFLAQVVSGEPINYLIAGNGAVTAASHPHSVLSFLRPGQPWDDEVMTTFCHYVWHFTGPATAQRWTAAHPGTFVLSLDDATELARRHTARAFGVTSA